MDKTVNISGYEVNVEYDKTGQIARCATVMVGDPDRPGMRANDGPDAQRARRKAREIVAGALGLDIKRVRAASRYTRLKTGDDGLIHDDTGGIYLA